MQIHYAHLKPFLSGKNRNHILTNLAVDVFEEHEGTHILQSLDGFALSLNSDGRFLYISETVSIYLGLSQVRKVTLGPRGDNVLDQEVLVH